MPLAPGPVQVKPYCSNGSIFTPPKWIPLASETQEQFNDRVVQLFADMIDQHPPTNDCP